MASRVVYLLHFDRPGVAAPAADWQCGSRWSLATVRSAQWVGHDTSVVAAFAAHVQMHRRRVAQAPGAVRPAACESGLSLCCVRSAALRLRPGSYGRCCHRQPSPRRGGETRTSVTSFVPAAQDDKLCSNAVRILLFHHCVRDNWWIIQLVCVAQCMIGPVDG